jgi:hypothetical protein
MSIKTGSNPGVIGLLPAQTADSVRDLNRVVRLLRIKGSAVSKNMGDDAAHISAVIRDLDSSFCNNLLAMVMKSDGYKKLRDRIGILVTGVFNLGTAKEDTFLTPSIAIGEGSPEPFLVLTIEDEMDARLRKDWTSVAAAARTLGFSAERDSKYSVKLVDQSTGVSFFLVLDEFVPF